MPARGHTFSLSHTLSISRSLALFFALVLFKSLTLPLLRSLFLPAASPSVPRAALGSCQVRWLSFSLSLSLFISLSLFLNLSLSLSHSLSLYVSDRRARGALPLLEGLIMESLHLDHLPLTINPTNTLPTARKAPAPPPLGGGVGSLRGRGAARELAPGGRVELGLSREWNNEASCRFRVWDLGRKMQGCGFAADSQMRAQPAKWCPGGACRSTCREKR